MSKTVRALKLPFVKVVQQKKLFYLVSLRSG